MLMNRAPTRRLSFCCFGTPRIFQTTHLAGLFGNCVAHGCFFVCVFLVFLCLLILNLFQNPVILSKTEPDWNSSKQSDLYLHARHIKYFALRTIRKQALQWLRAGSGSESFFFMFSAEYSLRLAVPGRKSRNNQKNGNKSEQKKYEWVHGH